MQVTAVSSVPVASLDGTGTVAAFQLAPAPYTSSAAPSPAPTAVHAVAEPHATASSWPVCAPVRSGAWLALQLAEPDPVPPLPVPPLPVPPLPPPPLLLPRTSLSQSKAA